MIEQYVGDSYRDDLRGNWSENNFFEFIRLTTGRIVFDNPKVTVKTRRPGMQAMIAQAMKYGLNRWVRDKNLRRLLKRVYATQCFSFCPVQTILEAQPWMDPREKAARYSPCCYMLEPDRFYFDPLCSWFGGARFIGHKYVRDVDDLLEEANEYKDRGWDKDAIEAVGEDAGIDEFKRPGNGEREGLTRKEMVIYETWVPEISVQDPEQGFNGTLYTIAASPSGESGGVYLRDPRGFYGPRRGPYTLFGVYPVPGDPYPLSPFAGTRLQSQELNDVVRGINKAIREYKRLIICSAENPDLAMKLKKPDNVIVPVKGFAKDQIVEMQVGGITDQHLKQLDISLARVDRATGISETRRGNITNATATEIASVENSGEVSLSYIKQEFADSVVQLLDSVGWGLYHDDRIRFPLGMEAMGGGMMNPQTGQPMRDPWFAGGMSSSDAGATYDDLELEIEPYSMERMNESLMRAQYAEMMQLVLAAAPLIPGTPFYDWKRLFEKGGEVMNDSQFADFYSPAVAQGQQQMAMQTQQAEQQAQQQQQQQGQADAQMKQQQGALDMQHKQVKMQNEAAKPALERMKMENDQTSLLQKAAAMRSKGKKK